MKKIKRSKWLDEQRKAGLARMAMLPPEPDMKREPAKWREWMHGNAVSSMEEGFAHWPGGWPKMEHRMRKAMERVEGNGRTACEMGNDKIFELVRADVVDVARPRWTVLAARLAGLPPPDRTQITPNELRMICRSRIKSGP